MRELLLLLIFSLGFVACNQSDTQITTQRYWHDQVRKVRYQPDGTDFVIKNGDRRFNRSLYGGNTAFRVEAGDLPEFALYLPGMGGNLQFVLTNGESFLPLIEAAQIEARYRPGSMLYEITDPLINDGVVHLTVIPTFDLEGVILKVQLENTDEDWELQWVFGGVSGKKFKRDGDLGADPESVFYLTPEKCLTNEIRIEGNGKATTFYGEGSVMSEEERYENESVQSTDNQERSVVKKSIKSIFPATSALKIADASFLNTPGKLWTEPSGNAPVLVGELSGATEFFMGLFPNRSEDLAYEDLDDLFLKAEEARAQLANRVVLKTPDAHLNTLGGALSVAADAVWEDPSFLHGAVAWRMPLVGWRGAYIGDWLGWHDRARTHFSAYAASQYTSPDFAPAAPDPNRNLARQIEKKGFSIFTKGYLSRRPGKQNSPHHYDMNLVYIDQLIRHFDWNGDLEYLREMWPVITRHMEWEKKNFDPDNDGLYNAYACIWASDALEYNGGGVAHSSAYNYYSNKRVAQLAQLIGQDGSKYKGEATKIKNALNNELWLREAGTYGEYKDNLGLKEIHENPGVWTIYHVIDSEVSDDFQAYQMVNYVDANIPHIPVRAEGLKGDDYHVLSTTNWQPYTWSVNNVALAEIQHTALAMWQAGASERAFKLWKSSLLESMYLGACPGNFQQLSFYDAMRGELYRDFSDPVAMTARSLVEGLFGFKPKLLEDKVIVAPAFPQDWDHASLSTPDFDISYKQNDKEQIYTVDHQLDASQLELIVPALFEKLLQVKVNGEDAEWQVRSAVGHPLISLVIPFQGETEVRLIWGGDKLYAAKSPVQITAWSKFDLEFGSAKVQETYDPQSVFDPSGLTSQTGEKILFASLKQGDFDWWEPVSISISSPLHMSLGVDSLKDQRLLAIDNRTNHTVSEIQVNDQKLEAAFENEEVVIPKNMLRCGTNKISVQLEDGTLVEQDLIDWEITNAVATRSFDISASFNDRVGSIFKNEYLSPRSPYPTLQLPKHGLGDWCSYAAYMEIDDSGLRKLAGDDQKISVGRNLSFSTPKDSVANIAYTSLWDNYPDSITVPLHGSAAHAYFLMAGSTNPMQSRFENGQIEIVYQDGSADMLILRNPESWYPIEQDYYEDGHAFTTGVPKPIRVHLKTGWVGREFSNYVSIDHFTQYAIDGGAATVLDLPLDPSKELRYLKLKTTANDVVIGLMAVSLLQNP